MPLELPDPPAVPKLEWKQYIGHWEACVDDVVLTVNHYSGLGCYSGYLGGGSVDVQPASGPEPMMVKCEEALLKLADKIREALGEKP